MDKKPLSLYVHWPFCKSKCPYCDFNSHVRQSIDESLWRDALIKELHRSFSQTGPRPLISIFFGGGTPSLMPSWIAADIIETASSLWSFSPSVEISLEANPNSVEVNNFQALRQAGINRVSLGIQSFNDADLKFLGRNHTATEAQKALETAIKIFPRVSFDLIYARPDQTLEQWQKELHQALDYGTEHLSLYQLTIEPGTAFAPLYARGDLKIPDEELAADLYELTLAETESVGLLAYEISNHAQEGAACRHNLTYWRYEDYVGIGPGAHGRLTMNNQKVATKHYRAPETWLKQVLDQGTGQEEQIILAPFDQCIEALLMGLRLLEPLDLSKLPLPPSFFLDFDKVNFLKEEGLLDGNKEFLQSTQKGWLKLNAVLKEIIEMGSFQEKLTNY